MARDILHPNVKAALIKEGWTITNDPLSLEGWRPGWEIDLGAERFIVAERGLEKIAVEVKGFSEQSFAYEFHRALGQYLNYKSGLKRLEPQRAVYIAVPIDVFNREFNQIGVLASIEDYDVRIIVFDPLENQIVSWNI
jgi:hypothetical protein